MGENRPVHHGRQRHRPIYVPVTACVDLVTARADVLPLLSRGAAHRRDVECHLVYDIANLKTCALVRAWVLVGSAFLVILVQD